MGAVFEGLTCFAGCRLDEPRLNFKRAMQQQVFDDKKLQSCDRQSLGATLSSFSELPQWSCEA